MILATEEVITATLKVISATTMVNLAAKSICDLFFSGQDYLITFILDHPPPFDRLLLVPRVHIM